MENERSYADRQALDELTNLVIARERSRRRPSFINPRHEWPLRAGERCVWLWYPYESASESLPIRAIILQRNKTQAQIRAEFAIGPVILWVGISRLRPVKKGR
jgi:hypothetical protein